MSDLFLVLLIVVLFGYWIYNLTTYDWTKFEEDSQGDDFLKPRE